MPIAAPHSAHGSIFLIVLADLMGFGVIIPLLPFYAKAYNATDFQVGLLFSVYSICQLVGSPVLGLMSDRFGRRPVLILSQLGSVIGYLILAYAMYHDSARPAVGLALVYASRSDRRVQRRKYLNRAGLHRRHHAAARSRQGDGNARGRVRISFTIGPAVGGLLGHTHAWWPAIAAAASRASRPS